MDSLRIVPEELLDRIESIISDLPEVESNSGGQHASFLVAGSKKFAWFLNDHHGDGMICLCVKADPEEKETLIDMDPTKYLRPAYVSRFGWMSIRLDEGNIDWDEIEQRLCGSYRMAAPKRLLKILDEKRVRDDA